MVANIAEGWDHINSHYHQYCLLKYMRAMKNPKAGPAPVSISYRKFFMLALALDQDINAISIDVSDPVAPIVARVSSDGTPVTGRKRRAPVSKRDQKRAKRLQRLVEESDDDEFSSEDDGRMDITIDSDNEAGEAPAEDQEDGVATVSDAVREGDDDLEERGADRERGDDEEHEGSSGDDDDIVDEREGADGDESEDYGIDSGDESEEPGKSGKGKGRVRTGGGKKKMKGSSRQKVRSSKRTKIKKPTRSRSRSGNKE